MMMLGGPTCCAVSNHCDATGVARKSPNVVWWCQPAFANCPVGADVLRCSERYKITAKHCDEASRTVTTAAAMDRRIRKTSLAIVRLPRRMVVLNWESFGGGAGAESSSASFCIICAG